MERGREGSLRAIGVTPLGSVLLSSDGQHLTGLYFLDQEDCPSVDGMPADAKIIHDPSAGQYQGRPARSLHAIPDPDRGQAGRGQPSLWPQPHDAATGPSDRATVPLRFLQDATPPQARALFENTQRELDEYFAGRRTTFDIPLAPHGTAFRERIWQALLAIPCGATISYGELAQKAGFGARYGRAAGSAVGSNPISIIIPCHRVLAASGILNGYGGGLSRKARLLELEGFTVQ